MVEAKNQLLWVSSDLHTCTRDSDNCCPPHSIKTVAHPLYSIASQAAKSLLSQQGNSGSQDLPDCNCLLTPSYHCVKTLMNPTFPDGPFPLSQLRSNEVSAVLGPAPFYFTSVNASCPCQLTPPHFYCWWHLAYCLGGKQDFHMLTE